MRRLLLATLVFAAVPALAQTDDVEVERRIVIDVDTLDGRFEVEIERDESDGERERRIVIRRGGDQDVVRLRVPDEDQIREMMDAARGAVTVFRPDDGDSVFESAFGPAGVSPETRTRMRELEAEARRLARTARASEGAERREAEAALDRTLDELFDVRADARRGRSDHLRERAAELEAEAAEIETGLADREARRRAILDARRDALLGRGDASDW